MSKTLCPFPLDLCYGCIWIVHHHAQLFNLMRADLPRMRLVLWHAAWACDPLMHVEINAHNVIHQFTPLRLELVRPPVHAHIHDVPDDVA